MTVRAVALDNLRALTTDELAAHLREQRGRLFQVRLQQTIGQVENHRQIRAIRQEIAQTMTVQVELRLAAERGEAPRAPRAVAAPAPASRRRSAADPDDTRGRSRRSPTAAVAPLEPAATPDAPVEEAISEVVVERIGPAAAGAEEESATPPPTGATDAVAVSTEGGVSAADDDDDDGDEADSDDEDEG
jgi:ribosomal protein L29